MSAALMFAARHLARYLTSPRLRERTNGNVPSRLANVCGSEYIRTHQRRAHKYTSSPEDRTQRVELRAAAPLVLSYSTARLDTRHDSLIGPRLKHPLWPSPFDLPPAIQFANSVKMPLDYSPPRYESLSAGGGEVD